jgi:hypothetical protein
MSRHLVRRVEEVIHFGVVSLERLVILLREGIEGGFDDVVLFEVGSVDASASLLHA